MAVMSNKNTKIYVFFEEKLKPPQGQIKVGQMQRIDLSYRMYCVALVI